MGVASLAARAHAPRRREAPRAVSEKLLRVFLMDMGDKAKGIWGLVREKRQLKIDKERK
jgi:hypothetical protein